MCGCMKAKESITSAQAAQMAGGQADRVADSTPKPAQNPPAQASSGQSSLIGAPPRS